MNAPAPASAPSYWPEILPYRPHLRFCSLGNANVYEVMESFRLACEKLSYTTSTSTVPDINNADINLFFFAMGLDWPYETEMPPNSIVVNFEPALPELLTTMPGYRRLLQRAYVWEYSLENMVNHGDLGILRSDYVPLTLALDATPLLPTAQVLDDAQQDIDVIFFGETTPRRLQVLRALQALGLNVAYPFGTPWTPAQRDALLPRAKVALNMRKLDNSATAELPRLSILLRHRKAVLSELYPHSEIPAVLRAAMEVCGYDELVERVLALVADAPRRRVLEQAGVAALLSLPPQHQILEGALRRYLDAASQRVRCEQAVQAPPPVLSRLTVLMVTHNNQAQIGLVLDSIAAQTRPPDELIVVDDASTDDTVALIRQRRQADPRLAGLRLMQAPSTMGWATAAQWGLTHATGDWLAFCDPVVTSSPERLQVQSAFLQASPAVAATGSWYRRSGDAEASAGRLDGDVDGLQRLPEMHEPILAALLTHQPLEQPLLLGSVMLSLRQLRHAALGFDAMLGTQAWLGLLLELVRAGGRLANMNVALCQVAGPPESTPPTLRANQNAQALAHLRERLLPLIFPRLPAGDAQRLARLYGLHWAPDPTEATALLREMAQACAGEGDAAESGNSTRYAAAVLRGQALRVLGVYAHNHLLPVGFVDKLMQEPLLRDFLAPLGERLNDFSRPA